MENQTPAPIVSLPQGALSSINPDAISALENADLVPSPVSENWDFKAFPKIRAFFDVIRQEYFPSLKQGAAEGEKDLVETVFFVAVINGEPRAMYCAAKQFVWKMQQMKALFPEGTNFPFYAEHLGDEKCQGKPFKYQIFDVRPLKAK